MSVKGFPCRVGQPLFLTRRLRGVVELIIVASVWGVLLALSASSYRVHVERARVAEVMTGASTIKQQLTAVYAVTGVWPSAVDYTTMQDPNGQDREEPQIEFAEGGFTFILEHRDRPYRVTFRAATSVASPGAPVHWLCGFALPPPGYRAVTDNRTDMPPSYLPKVCRGD